MATIVETSPATPPPAIIIEDVHPTAERSFVTSPIGWGSIFAATVITLGVWLALHLFGIGVGLTAIDPSDSSSLRGVGMGVGIWSLIAPILAMFIGGLVAGRVAPTINTLNAAIHGAAMWALASLVAMMMIMSMLGSLARGAAATGSAVGRATAGAVGAASGGAADLSMDQLGIDANDLIAPINKQLAARGMPPVDPNSVELAAKDAMRETVRGDMNREKLVGIVERRTSLSRQDAEQLAGQLEQRLNQAKTKAQDVAGQAQQTALQVAETSGKLLLTLFATLVLSLGAAILGSILSVRRERREHVVLPRASTTRA